MTDHDIIPANLDKIYGKNITFSPSPNYQCCLRQCKYFLPENLTENGNIDIGEGTNILRFDLN